MKRLKSKSGVLALATLSLALLSGCGQNSGNSNQVLVPPVGGVGPGGLVSGGCVPLNGQGIPFTGNNIYYDWANVVGGVIPMSNQAVGQVVVGGTVIAPQYTGGGSQMGRTNYLGSSIIMNVTQGGGAYPGGYPYQGFNSGSNLYGSPYGGAYPSGGYNPSSTTVQGTLTISSAELQQIMYYFGNGGFSGSTIFPQNPAYSYPGSYYPGQSPIPYNGASSLCASGVSFNVGHYYSTIYGGGVYLYLNNTQHGYIVSF